MSELDHHREGTLRQGRRGEMVASDLSGRLSTQTRLSLLLHWNRPIMGLQARLSWVPRSELLARRRPLQRGAQAEQEASKGLDRQRRCHFLS